MRQCETKRYWILYPVWVLFCATAFIVLFGADDPARPSGRMTPGDAKTVALEHLRAFDENRFGAYDVIDASFYRDPLGDAKVWIVLCDTSPRSGLTRAVVVDIDAQSRSVLRTRRPSGVELEEFPIP